jgi:hypothetical protein
VSLQASSHYGNLTSSQERHSPRRWLVFPWSYGGLGVAVSPQAPSHCCLLNSSQERHSPLRRLVVPWNRNDTLRVVAGGPLELWWPWCGRVSSGIDPLRSLEFSTGTTLSSSLAGGPLWSRGETTVCLGVAIPSPAQLRYGLLSETLSASWLVVPCLELWWPWCGRVSSGIDPLRSLEFSSGTTLSSSLAGGPLCFRGETTVCLGVAIPSPAQLRYGLLSSQERHSR